MSKMARMTGSAPRAHLAILQHFVGSSLYIQKLRKTIIQENLSSGFWDYSLFFFAKRVLSNLKIDSLRFIAANTVITSSILQPEQIVKRGERVMIVAGNKSFSVETKGVARGNGGMKERIKVFNSSSRRVIEAIIVGPGKVRA